MPTSTGTSWTSCGPEIPPAVHPVARPHPRTGRLTLFVNGGFTTELVDRDGSPVDDGDELLNLLCRQAETPEYHCRVRWAPDTVVHPGTTKPSNTTESTTTTPPAE